MVAGRPVEPYEQGRMIPSDLVLRRLAGLYGVPVEALYDPADPTDPVTLYSAGLEALAAAAPPLSPGTRAELGALVRLARDAA